MEELYTWKDPLFIGLWHSSWQASVLIGVVLLLQCLFGKKLSPGWRFGLWLLVVARLALPVTPESSYSIFNVSIFDGMRVLRPGTQSFGNLATPPIASPVANKHRRAASPLAAQRPEIPATSPQASDSSLLNAMLKPILTWIPSIWIVGVLLQTVRISWQNVRFANRLKCCRRAVGYELVELLEECKGLMGIRHHITLLETPQVRSPALYGLFRPKLLLPEHLVRSFSREELRYVLLHELAHVRRSDMAVNWLMTVVQIMHWFNPLVWFAFNRMRADRELACDALVLSQPNEREMFNYGATLIRLLEGFSSPAPLRSLMGILQDRNQIQQRIRTIANFKAPSRRSGWAVLLIVGLGVVGLTDARTPKGISPGLGPDFGDNPLARGQVPPRNASSGIRVTGRVIDKTTSRPIDDYSVLIRKWLGGKNEIWSTGYEATTSAAVGSNGEFSLTLTNGINSYDIEIRAEGYISNRSGWTILEDGDRGLLYSLSKALPLESSIRSRKSRPAKDMEAPSGKGAAQSSFTRSKVTKGGAPGGIPTRGRPSATARAERRSVGSTVSGWPTQPASGRTMEWRSKDHKLQISITDRFPMGALPLLLHPERFSTTTNAAPEPDQPIAAGRETAKTPLTLAQNGDAPSPFATTRIRADRTRSVQ